MGKLKLRERSQDKVILREGRGGSLAMSTERAILNECVADALLRGAGGWGHSWQKQLSLNKRRPSLAAAVVQ